MHADAPEIIAHPACLATLALVRLKAGVVEVNAVCQRSADECLEQELSYIFAVALRKAVDNTALGPACTCMSVGVHRWVQRGMGTMRVV